MFKIILINTFSLVLLASCAGSPPKMEGPVTVWNGAPEKDAICTLTPDQVADHATANTKNFFVHAFALAKLKETLRPQDAAERCIDARDPVFAKFAALTFNDIGIIQRYTEALINSCAKWK